MWSLQNLLLVLCSLSCWTCAAGVIQVFGYEGGGVKISCSYDEGYENYKKYFCKGNCWFSRDGLIKTPQRNKHKYFIYDDKKSRIFNVSISDVRLHDAGTYWCGVKRTGYDLYTEVRLEVIKDSCCDKVTEIQGNEEGSVSIRCLYESKYQKQLKYICRGNQPSTCLQQALITSNNRQNGRFTLSHDQKSETFTVTNLNLTLKDSGSYLCGVQTDTGLDVFSAFKLEVKEMCKVNSSNIRAIVGHPVTFQCSSSQHRDTKKFLCKGDQPNNCTDMMTNQTKFSLLNVSSSCFSVTITELEAGDAGTYFCGSDSQLRFKDYTEIQLAVESLQQSSTVTPISSSITSLSPSPHESDVNLLYILPAVLVLLLILTFALFMVFKNKSKSLKVGGVGMSGSNTAGSDEETRINDIYGLEEDESHMNHEANPIYGHSLTEDNIYCN
ncbi:polymeric immunoglobulin receptor isoform X2 [Kryptolebias marmoratus]|uniref:polymeric immunoglobulin receptor isoform X2 n=1 Tax=Kryptolebias marmoratus TaxID=37003 RepID=UPI0018ACCF7C|nr:polymeric immunoglobulin receptor isoform X2 [Kryptolebias marmoratus]